RVTRQTAQRTGLVEGTAVVAGLHDVMASALGAGRYGQGTAALGAGAYSINDTLASQPAVDRRWFCRHGMAPGRWKRSSISPASSANYEWFLETLCRAARANGEDCGTSIHTLLAPEIEAAMERQSTVLFHPFLFGSPYGAAASASFFGPGGWHARGDMVRAVLERIALTHRTHVDARRHGVFCDQ